MPQTAEVPEEEDVTQYIARWGVWGPRELDRGAFVSMVQASMPLGWRILEDQLVVAPERVTLVPHHLLPGDTPPDAGTTDLEVQGGRYAGWWKGFANSEVTKLGATPSITGYRVPIEVPAALDEASRRTARRAINAALARYENEGFFGHNPGVTLRAVGESDAAYAAIDRPVSSGGSRSGLLFAAGLVAIGALAYTSSEKK